MGVLCEKRGGGAGGGKEGDGSQHLASCARLAGTRPGPSRARWARELDAGAKGGLVDFSVVDVSFCFMPFLVTLHAN